MEMDHSSSALLHLPKPQSYLSIPIILDLTYNQSEIDHVP